MLRSAAKKFKADYGFPPSLEIDKHDTNFIAAKDIALLTCLQYLAKEGADNRLLQIIFVTSDASTLSVLQASSAIARASILEAGDILDEIAIKYLLSEGVPAERVADAVGSITGGRFTLLDEYISQCPRMSNDEIRKIKFARICAILVAFNLSCNHGLLQQLVKNLSVYDADFLTEGVSIAVKEQLVLHNILFTSSRV
jgi:hypothetical protein